ncbi:hypothetical protein BN1723_008253 [Verticillium longisporum]|uniref:Myb-like domain-containing protein n=1 Tax=Verticillium longisporum TaxID=100787 RepID=A0A0G4NR21_VERLO|nr:hypothetical protein BN1723_008253 [Verticillium longisporum]
MIFFPNRARVAKHQGESRSTPSALPTQRQTFQMSFDQESDSDRESSIEGDNRILPRAELTTDVKPAARSARTRFDPPLPAYGGEGQEFQSQESGDESDNSDYTPPVLRTFSSLNPPSYSDDDENDDDDDEEEQEQDNSQRAEEQLLNGYNMYQPTQHSLTADQNLKYSIPPIPSQDELPQPIYSSEDEDRPLDKYAILAAASKERTPEPIDGLPGPDEDVDAPPSAQPREDIDTAIKRSSPTTPLSLLRKATKRNLTHSEKERRADKKRLKTKAAPAVAVGASFAAENAGMNGDVLDDSTPSDPDFDDDPVTETTPSKQAKRPQATPVLATTPASQKRKQQSKPTFALASQRKPLKTYRLKSSSIRSDPYIEDDSENGSGNGGDKTNGEHAASPTAEASGQTMEQSKLSSSAQKERDATSRKVAMGNGNVKARNSKAASGSTPTPRRSTQTPTSTRKTKKRASQPNTPTTPQNPLNRVFNKDDLLRITQAIESFGAQHKLTQVEINDMIQERFGAGRHSFNEVLDTLWNTIFSVCPGKTRQKTIDYCRKNFHNFKARGGNWTVEEDEDLAMLVEQHGKQWTKLSKELNRHPDDIRDRYRNYVICGQNLDRSGWTDDEERLLLRFVEEARETLKGPLRTRPIESTIDWQKISDEFGRSRSRLQCFTKWKRLQGE